MGTRGAVRSDINFKVAAEEEGAHSRRSGIPTPASGLRGDVKCRHGSERTPGRCRMAGDTHGTQTTSGSSTAPGGSVPVAAFQPIAARRALIILAMARPMPAAAPHSRASATRIGGWWGRTA